MVLVLVLDPIPASQKPASQIPSSKLTSSPISMKHDRSAPDLSEYEYEYRCAEYEYEYR
jgi:hypothetical protein